MFSWLFKRKTKPEERAPAAGSTVTTVERVREKYLTFRELLTLNTECLEVIVGLQEDLTYIPPQRDVVEARVGLLFEKARGIVASLDKLTGFHHERLIDALRGQRHEVERYIADLQELKSARLAAWIYEIGVDDVSEVGGKAATLGEVRQKLGLPVPNGYALTTEAYRQFCGLPNWVKIRDAIHEIDHNDLEALRDSARILHEMVMETPLPRAVEVALLDRAKALETDRFAVRSSAFGEGAEGGARTLAGQFLSLINVSADQIVDAYKQVVASRFSERALAYRLSTGLLEVETPMAVLILPALQVVASGIMYTRDPSNPKSKELWITATPGFGLDIASGKTPADLFIVSRRRRFQVLETQLASKSERPVLGGDGGLARDELSAEEAGKPSVDPAALETLAGYGVKIEDYFNVAQDVEWAIDRAGQIWILQTRPLALVEARASRQRAKARQEPILTGGRTIYPGQVSGAVYFVEDARHLGDPPEGAIVFLRRASPEIVQIFPRISGLVAEWGNVAGHAAALLREFKIPSVFLMEGASDRVADGDRVSLDSIQAALYKGQLWDQRAVDGTESVAQQTTASDPISRNILTLNLLDPSSSEFRPSSCRSTHDVLRYCHEKSIEAMFTVNDIELDHGQHTAKDLKTELPLNLSVLDLGGGIELDDPDAREVTPEQVVSLPFKALWRGITHPEVTWKREMPASLSDMASVMASSIKPLEYPSRPLGRKSYLLAAEEYMNLNARVAYHFTLVDASLTGLASKNYVAFRFVGGGATAFRRNLRAIFLEEVLARHGFLVDRRGDLVNAWLKKAPATDTFTALDILGRLLACTSQLDMYMTSKRIMRWFVRQFMDGNYKFVRTEDAPDPFPGDKKP